MPNDRVEAEGCHPSHQPGKGPHVQKEKNRLQVLNVLNKLTVAFLKLTLSRAYGGVLSHKAVREKIVRAFLILILIYSCVKGIIITKVRAFLIEEQKIVMKVLKAQGKN